MLREGNFGFPFQRQVGTRVGQGNLPRKECADYRKPHCVKKMRQNDQ